ncbi:hypothetical protein ABTZ92_27210 [Streptomyces albidoflavus]|uniref:hypothetical protein n=1 Tax=Streptomyces albidoflavus TaxID=1886 RepID=UPI003328953D
MSNQHEEARHRPARRPVGRRAIRSAPRPTPRGEFDDRLRCRSSPTDQSPHAGGETLAAPEAPVDGESPGETGEASQVATAAGGETIASTPFRRPSRQLAAGGDGDDAVLHEHRPERRPEFDGGLC